MPLNRIIGEEKLKYIKDLIGTSALSFTEIAELCGFSNEYALNRFFKYAEGYTLGQYRKLAMLFMICWREESTFLIVSSSLKAY